MNWQRYSAKSCGIYQVSNDIDYQQPFLGIIEGYAVNYTSAVMTIAMVFPCPFEEDTEKTIQIFVEATRTTLKG